MSLIRFNLRKSTQALCLLLQKEGGKMNYMKAIKELYLSDREALARWERTITGDAYVSMKHGPVLSNLLDQINNKSEDPDSYWEKHIVQNKAYIIELRTNKIEDDELSNREIKLLKEMQEKFKNYSEWSLVDYCHEHLGEWGDPGGSANPITIEDILKNLNKSTQEIKAITDEIAASNHAKNIFSC